MEPYSGFAMVYDTLMVDVPYDKWIDNIKKIIIENKFKIENVLELACGTGNISLRLSELGYKVTGIDISDEMLSIAKNKALLERKSIEFFNQNISEFKFSKKFDCIVCVCDGINYITDPEDIENLFSRVYETLGDDGLFVFDISSYYKLKNILGNNNICESGEDVSFIWENYFDEEENLLEFDLSIFMKEDKHYRRYDETHVQKAYKVDDLKSIISGKFEIIKIFSEEYLDVTEDTERIFFALRKII